MSKLPKWTEIQGNDMLTAQYAVGTHDDDANSIRVELVRGEDSEVLATIAITDAQADALAAPNGLDSNHRQDSRAKSLVAILPRECSPAVFSTSLSLRDLAIELNLAVKTTMLVLPVSRDCVVIARMLYSKNTDSGDHGAEMLSDLTSEKLLDIGFVDISQIIQVDTLRLAVSAVDGVSTCAIFITAIKGASGTQVDAADALGAFASRFREELGIPPPSVEVLVYFRDSDEEDETHIRRIEVGTSGNPMVGSDTYSVFKHLGLLCPDLANHVSPSHVLFDRSQTMALFVLGVSDMLADMSQLKATAPGDETSRSFLDNFCKGIVSNVCVVYAIHNGCMASNIENCIRAVCPVFSLRSQSQTVRLSALSR